MPDVILPDVQPVTPEALSGSTYIILLNPEKVPPHLLLCVNKKLFSLSVNGTTKKPIDRLLSQLDASKSKALFIQLTESNRHTNSDLEAIAHRCFDKYRRVSVDGPTCLQPIKDYCTHIYSKTMSNANFIFELVMLLGAETYISSVYQQNMENNLDGNGRFKMTTYTMDDIRNCILELQPERV